MLYPIELRARGIADLKKTSCKKRQIRMRRGTYTTDAALASTEYATSVKSS
jgi:hypothetical protein